jgi:protein-tyrosine phosphatase
MSIVPQVDLHCHLLPNWDDGPQSLDESLAMAAKAQASGIKRIVVTPHVGRTFSSRSLPPGRDVPHATSLLQSKVHAAGIDIELLPGAELTFDFPELTKRIAEEPWLTVGGKGSYILIESTYGRWPPFADQMLYQLSLVGVTSIIAHPERLPDVRKNIHLLDNALAQGALLQITARSFLSEEEYEYSRCSYKLLKAGMVALVASDAHNSKSVLPAEVVDKVSAVVGADAARQILVDNANAVVVGGAAFAPPVGTLEKKSRPWPFRKLMSRLKS